MAESDVYDPNQLKARVNYAARRIMRQADGVPQGRVFDTCFEMGDGDAVIDALMTRAERNPHLAARLACVLSTSAIEDSRKRLQRGAVSLPLLTFQACAALGLASALWSLYLRLVAQIGGLGL